MDEWDEPITFDGHRLAVGDRVTFDGRSMLRYRSATVESLDGSFVSIRLGKRLGSTWRHLVPAGWLLAG